MTILIQESLKGGHILACRSTFEATVQVDARQLRMVEGT